MLRLTALLLLLVATGCETVHDSARRSAERAAGRATERAVEGAIDGAAARATDAATTAAGAPASGRAPGGAAAAGPTAAGPATDCAALLPDAEVARVCRVAVAGDAVNERPGECSRAYLRRGGDPETGLVLTVHTTGAVAEARTMVQLESAMATGGPSRALPGVGDGGVARTLTAPAAMGMGYTEHTVAFSSGATFAQLKAGQIADDRPALCTLDQMETLARGVAGRLR